MIEIVTVGSDSWREICGPFFGLTQLKIPITANGVLYWEMGKEYFVSVDVRNEMFCKIPFPNCRLDSYHMLELGNTLSLASHMALNWIDMWELKDFHEGKRVKQLSIKYFNFSNIMPYKEKSSSCKMLQIFNLRKVQMIYLHVLSSK